MPARIAEVCQDRAMTPSVVQRWTSIIENGRTDELDALLADDAVFFAPAVFTPQEGRRQTLMYLEVAAKVFGDTDFHNVEQWYMAELLQHFTAGDGPLHPASPRLRPPL
jgi:hypothetical protein